MEPEFLHLIFLPSKHIVLFKCSQSWLSDIANCTSFIAGKDWTLREALRKMPIIHSECDMIFIFFSYEGRLE